MICPNCGKEIADGSNFCVECGANINPNAQVYNQAKVDLKDHTSEFDGKDISDNKVFAALPYLMGVVGCIIAAIAANKSKYARFNVRESLKFTVCQTLLSIIAAVLVVIGTLFGGISTLSKMASDPFYALRYGYSGLVGASVFSTIVLVALGICLFILLVCRIIAFVRILQGKAKEAPIVGSFGFLK